MADRPDFLLTVVTSSDGYIARSSADSPQLWASPEEQAMFFRDVEAADWGIMGRNTHNEADRPDRFRIVFSRTVSGWRSPRQLWLNPDNLTPSDLPGLVGRVRALEKGLILGGTGVHDWFLRHDVIDHVHLSVEPVTFGSGLPLFSGKGGQDPHTTLAEAGFAREEEERLNEAGTMWSRWTRIR